MSLHFHPLRVKSVRPESEEAVVVSFDVPPELAEEFRFTHGQHLTLRHTIGASEERRSYSICAAPADGELRVGVRKVPGGVFSTWLNESLQPGDTLQVMTPEGPLLRPARSEREPALPRHRRRQRHHADPLDPEGGARRRAEVDASR